MKHDIDFRIVGFLNFRRTALYMVDPRLKECSFPTPRSWEHTSLLIKDFDSSQLGLIQQVVATQVGVGIAGEFATFIRVKDKLHPMDYYLKDPDNCQLPDENTQPDLIWALITSIAEYYKAHTDIETLKKVIKLLRRVNEALYGLCVEVFVGSLFHA